MQPSQAVQPSVSNGFCEIGAWHLPSNKPGMQTQMVWPSYEHIARVAYRIYRERDAASGPELADWLQAEQLLLQYLNQGEDSPAGGQTVRMSGQR